MNVVCEQQGAVEEEEVGKWGEANGDAGKLSVLLV